MIRATRPRTSGEPRPAHPHAPDAASLPERKGKEGGREGASGPGGGAGDAEVANPLISPPLPRPALPFHQRDAAVSGACHGSRPGIPPPLYCLPFLFFFPLSFFVNERKRSRAVPRTAALDILAAASSEQAGRSSCGRTQLSASARLLQPPQPEDPRRRRGPAA